MNDRLVRVVKLQTMRHGNRGFSTNAVIILLLFLLASAGVVWVYTGVIARERWPIRWLEIDGQFERVSAEQVRASLTPLVKGSFFAVDLASLYQTAGSLPWVSSVSVQKIWPDSIQVSIKEYKPVSHWIDGFMVAADGRSFKVPRANEIQGLPWLEGPESQQDVVFESWRKIDDELVRIGQQIDRLSLDARGSWSAVLSGGTEVRFGKGDLFESLEVMVSSWAGLMRGQSLPPISIDLRYTNGFAVLWPQNTDTIAGNYGKER